MAAAISVALGVTLLNMGVASATSRPSKFPIITFIPSSDEVTLLIPTPPCRNNPPGCVWKLSVNEPFEPGAPLLGVATGTTGLLTVTYPTLSCGVIQGDASVELQADVIAGSGIFKLKFGHRITVDCPTTTTKPGGDGTTTTTKPQGGGTSTTTTTKPGGGTTNTTKPGGGPGTTKPVTTKPVKVVATKPVKVVKTKSVKAVKVDPNSHLPVTGATSSSTSTSGPSHAVQTAAITQLPFTGIDVRPLGLFGVALVALGSILLATLETRRRALRRLRYAAQMQRARASRASRWFLGD